MKAAMTVNLDNAIRAALVLIRVDSEEDLATQAELARKCLGEAVATTGVPSQALACVAAADEHLEYGELMEARTLLTVARGLLPVQRSVVLPSPSAPGDTVCGASPRG